MNSTMIKKLKGLDFKITSGLLIKNIFLALIITTTFAAIDYVFRRKHHLEMTAAFTFYQLGMLFLFSFLLSLLKKSRNALIIYSLLVFFLFVQWVHYNYFGVLISPIEISLFFSHRGEAMSNFADMLSIARMPFLFCIAMLFITGFAFYLCSSRIRSRFSWFFLILVFLIPINMMIFPMLHHKVGRDPHISIGDRPNIYENIWFSTQKLLIFYTIYTLPHQYFFANPLPQTVHNRFPVAKHPNINIIYIQGESLTWKHMSLYGYHRETTPYLESLKNNPNVIFKKGISAGVSTDVSLPEFFNMVMAPDGTQQIISTNRNLFKMAKQNGFDTHFISVQFDQWFGLITTYLYPAYINHFQILGKSINYVPDETLVEYIKNTDLNQKNFLVVQMGGSHEPYELRFPPQFDIFKSTPASSFKQTKINNYDNSVLHTDNIIKNIVAMVQQNTTKPTYIIFTSDHGESLGYMGHFGHNNLRINQEHEVPIMIMALNGAPLDFMKELDREEINPQYMSHYELATVIAYLLGYKVKHFATQHRGYYVTGAILNGFGGFEHILFDPQGRQHIHKHSVD